MRKILSIAHRGASGYFPENTIGAFEKAFELDCDGIELDVHLTSDGEIIVIHDNTIDRTTNGIGSVENLSWQAIQSMGIPDAQIPTLSEVLSITPKNCLVNIELKSADTVKPVEALIESCVANDGWDYSSFLISSFDWIALKEIQKINPRIPVGVITETDLELAIAYADLIHANSVHAQYHLLTAENTIAMQHKGLKVFAWTINEPTDIDLIKSYNVDAIITDFPDRV